MVNTLIAIFIFGGLTGKIQGIVKDDNTRLPIALANVIISGTEMGASTDDEGNFFILNIQPGNYTIEVSCVGYQIKRIGNVAVNVDQTTRLDIELVPSLIDIIPITVIGETPTIQKDYVGAIYIVRKGEIVQLPFDYTTDMVAFQPAVARTDTAIHVRGGRATEVNYMIDNVSIIDPQTGDPAISVSKGTLDEVIFLPGSFDAEYGHAMSGIVNMITEHPQDKLGGKIYGKTETIMPYYYDFGYRNYQSSVHLPLSRKSKGFLSFDVMNTDDWDPRLHILPHKQRNDYALYGKWLFTPSGKLRISLSGAKSRTQFDRYAPGKTRLLQNHYRSDLRKGDLQVFNLSLLPNSRSLFNLTLSRLFTDKNYGVRNEGPYGVFDDFTFRDFHTYKPMRYDNKNPWGVWSPQFYTEGDYGSYQNKSSQILKANGNTNLQIHKYHELKAGFEFTFQELRNFTYLLSADTLHPMIDEYLHRPKEYSVFIQDNIDYQGLYSKLGLRFEYLSSDIIGISPNVIVSPRFGVSFLVTDRLLFRANAGRYIQPPLYDYAYSMYSLLPRFPSYWRGSLIGNPALKPEKTTSYEIGMQGEIRQNLHATVNVFFKDVSDLIGTRLAHHIPYYITYMNTEFANVKGAEVIFDFKEPWLTGKISYTLSWARGTSSYATEVYSTYFFENPDTNFVPPAEEYYLDFDQRHRIFVQGLLKCPMHINLYLLGYFGNGFPYTPPGPEGKYEERNIVRFPFQKQIDCVVSRSFKIPYLSMNVSLEIVNVLDARYEIAWHGPFITPSAINPSDFDDYYISIANTRYYHPAADFNHDGLITPNEYYVAFLQLAEATDDLPNAYTAPRRARIAISIDF